jgi:hypothetical protein
MPKYTVSIAREEVFIYQIEVEAPDESQAEDKAWYEFNTDTSISDDGKLVHANEYVDFVQELETT